jgi:MFS family permease
MGSVLLENGAMSWSVIYFRDMFDAPEWLESLSLPAFLLAVALGRMFSDRWVDRYGAARVASVLSIVAMVGLLPIAWAGSLPLAFLGFVVVGIGVSVAYPLSISGAARIADRPASENVAAFSVLQRTLVLAAPAITGFVAAGWGIAGAFAAMLPLPLIAILCARYLEPKPVAAAKAAGPA